MIRKQVIAISLVLLMGLGWSLVGGTQSATGTTHFYFFTVPSLLSDGSSAEKEILALKGFLIDTAGGYSGLGETEGGWKSPEGEIETEVNQAFFVSCPKDISNEIYQFIQNHFGQSNPYVISWEATSPDPIYTSSIPFWSKRK